MRTSAHSGSSGWASDLPDPRDTAEEEISVTGLERWEATGGDELGIDVDVEMENVGGNAKGVDAVEVENAPPDPRDTAEEETGITGLERWEAIGGDE